MKATVDETRFLDLVRAAKARHRAAGAFRAHLARLAPEVLDRLDEVEDKILEDEPRGTGDRDVVRAVLAELVRLEVLPRPSAKSPAERPRGRVPSAAYFEQDPSRWTARDERRFRGAHALARWRGMSLPTRPRGVLPLDLPGTIDTTGNPSCSARPAAGTPPAATNHEESTTMSMAQETQYIPRSTAFMARARAHAKAHGVTLTVAMSAIASADPAAFEAHKRASAIAAPSVHRAIAARKGGR